MTAVQLNMDIQNKLGLFSDNINVLENISKFLDSLIAKKQDESLMTKDEFFAKLDKSKAQIERGECTRFTDTQKMVEWLDSL